jgi:putative phage-type endonuclease
METLNLVQGSPEWLAVRATHFTASEAAAMLGISKYQTRNELLKQKATGLAPEVDANKQFLFDRGHAAEARARPIVEERIGEELFPATGVLEVEGLPLLASFDGSTMAEDTNWENKLPNADLKAAVQAGRIPEQYHPQLEQGLLVSGAKKCYFTTSDGTAENTFGCWYKSNPELRARLLSGWKQFAEDLKNYQHVEIVEAPKADVIEQLPVVVVNVTGALSGSNLAAVTPRFDSFLATVNKDLKTDNDFANGESTARFSRGTAKALRTKSKEVIDQVSDISDAIRVLDLYADKFDALGLELEKLVKSRKEAIRNEIIAAAKAKFAEHVANLNRRLGKSYMPVVAADFAGVIKNKRTVASLHDAVDTELARVKIEANEIADRIETNIKISQVVEYPFLFSDLATICTKAPEDFVAAVKVRISDHLAQEDAKAEAQRARIRDEEIAKIQRESARLAALSAVETAAASEAIICTGSKVVIEPTMQGPDQYHMPAGVVISSSTFVSNISIRDVSDDTIFALLATTYGCSIEDAEERIRRINAPTYINLPKAQPFHA